LEEVLAKGRGRKRTQAGENAVQEKERIKRETKAGEASLFRYVAAQPDEKGRETTYPSRSTRRKKRLIRELGERGDTTRFNEKN